MTFKMNMKDEYMHAIGFEQVDCVVQSFKSRAFERFHVDVDLGVANGGGAISRFGKL